MAVSSRTNEWDRRGANEHAMKNKTNSRCGQQKSYHHISLVYYLLLDDIELERNELIRWFGIKFNRCKCATFFVHALSIDQQSLFKIESLPTPRRKRRWKSWASRYFGRWWNEIFGPKKKHSVITIFVTRIIIDVITLPERSSDAHFVHGHPMKYEVWSINISCLFCSKWWLTNLI